MSKMKFLLPGLYENFQLNINLFDAMKRYPTYFNDNIDIHAFYGNFQYCIWDGGRIFGEYKHATLEEIQKIQEAYNHQLKKPMRFIFTNNQLKEYHLNDRFGNLILNLCHNELNEIVVNSSLLENYIRTNYPKYKIISSTTKCLSSPNKLKEELNKDYEFVCLDYNLNKNEKMLNELTPAEKNKAEFLVNAICPSGCKNRSNHYRLNSLYHLNYGKKYNLNFCEICRNNLHPIDEMVKNNLSFQDCKQYFEKGFNNFKLEGRTFDKMTLASNYVNYLVKPEYQLFILNILVNQDVRIK